MITFKFAYKICQTKLGFKTDTDNWWLFPQIQNQTKNKSMDSKEIISCSDIIYCTNTFFKKSPIIGQDACEWIQLQRAVQEVGESQYWEHATEANFGLHRLLNN